MIFDFTKYVPFRVASFVKVEDLFSTLHANPWCTTISTIHQNEIFIRFCLFPSSFRKLKLQFLLRTVIVIYHWIPDNKTILQSCIQNFDSFVDFDFICLFNVLFESIRNDTISPSIMFLGMGLSHFFFSSKKCFILILWQAQISNNVIAILFDFTCQR